MPYQAGDILVRAVMSNANGLVDDQFVNDFAFRQALEQTPAEMLALVSRVNSFYNGTGEELNIVSHYISTSVNRAATHRMDLYRIAAGGLGSPILSVPWLGPGAPIAAAENLPNEVAAVVSFHADLTGVLEESGATRPKARRRGRLYVGPLGDNALSGDIPNPLFSDTFLGTLRHGITDVAAGNDVAGQGGAFSVWSREDQELRRVIGGWTDNAPDTLRKRGQASTARVVFGGSL